MSIIFEIKGKQYRYIPSKDQTFHIDYQKNTKSGDEIILDKILSKDEQFGQPYLSNFKLIGEIIKHGKKAKIVMMKYKPKTGNKIKKGNRQKFTKMKIKSVQEGEKK